MSNSSNFPVNIFGKDSSSFSLTSSYIDYSNIDNVPDFVLESETSSMVVLSSSFSLTSSYISASNIDGRVLKAEQWNPIVFYLTADGVSGSKSGENGATLNNSTWSISRPGVYYVDSDLGSIRVELPDSDITNDGDQYEFRVPNLSTTFVSVTLATPSNQKLGPVEEFILSTRGECVKFISNNFIENGSSGRKWRQVWSVLKDPFTFVVSKEKIKGDFTSIKDACDFINGLSTSTNRFNIDVKSGIYIEDEINVGSYISINGSGDISTIISASNISNTMMTLGSYSEVNNLQLRGATNGVGFNLSGSLSLLDSVNVINCKTGYHAGFPNGKLFGSSVGYSRTSEYDLVATGSDIVTFVESSSKIEFNFLLFNNFDVNPVYRVGYALNDGSQLTIYNTTIKNCQFPFESDAGGEINIFDSIITNYEIAFKCGDLGSPKLGIFTVINNCDDCEYDLFSTNPNAIIKVVGSELSYNKTFVNNSQLIGTFISLDDGDKSLQVRGELSVGSPQLPSESSFGEGDSYTSGLLIYQSGSSGISENKAISASLLNDGLTLSIFQSTSSGEQFYISSDVLFNGNHIKHQGFKYQLVSASLGGSILSYYWNGSDWQSFNYMTTEASTDYLPLGKQFGVTTGSSNGSYHLRYDIDLETSGTWVSKTIGTDEVSEPSRFWIKWEVVSPLTVIPVIDQIKLHSNRTEINSDGFIEYFGNARVRKTLSWNWGLVEGVNLPGGSGVASNDIFFSDQLAVGRFSNTFDTGEKNSAGFTVKLPSDLDTSSTILCKIWFIVLNNNSGDINWEFHYTYDTIGGIVATNTAGVASSHINEQVVVKSTTIPSLSINKLFQETFVLRVPNSITYRKTSPGDIFAVTITRFGNVDTLSADISIVDIEASYVSWNNGEHINF